MTVQDLLAQGVAIPGEGKLPAGVKPDDQIAATLLGKYQVFHTGFCLTTPRPHTLHLDHHVRLYRLIEITSAKEITAKRGPELSDRRGGIGIARRRPWQATLIKGEPPLKDRIGSVRTGRLEIGIRDTPSYAAQCKGR